MDDRDTPGTYYDYSDGTRSVTNDGSQGTANYRPAHSAVFTNDGQVTYAYDYDATDDGVSAPNAISGTPATMMCWVRLSSIGTQRRILNVGVAGTTQNMLALYYSSTSDFKAQHWDGTSSVASSTTTPASNTWYHIAAVFNDNTTRLIYVNGVGEGTNAAARSAMSGLDYTGVGYLDWSSRLQFMHGEISDVRVLDYAAPSSEISGIYDDTKKRYGL